jgi:hypothetical protein
MDKAPTRPRDRAIDDCITLMTSIIIRINIGSITKYLDTSHTAVEAFFIVKNKTKP